jgi:hypothetical protein
MITKRTHLKFFISIVEVLFFTFLFICCNHREFSNSSAINAVPSSSPIFIKINDPVKLLQVLGKQNEWWKLLGNIEKVKPLQKGIVSIDSIMNVNSDFKRFIKGKEIVFSLNPEGNNEINVLAIIPVNVMGDQSLAENFINEFVNTRHLHSARRKFNKVSLYELTSNGVNNFNLTYSFYREFLILSPKATLVEKAIRQLESNSGEENPELGPLLKTINNQAEINIFINHQTAGEMLSNILSEPMQIKASLMKNYSGWTELDATIKDVKFYISGFTNGEIQKNYFSNILLHQQPGISKIESVLPSNIKFFSGYYLSDIERFFDDYQRYLTKLNLFTENHERLKEIEKISGFNLKNIFIDIFDNEIAESAICNDPMTDNPYRVWTIKTKSGSFALKKMKDFQEAYIKSTKKTSAEWEKDFKIDNQTNIKFYKFPVEDMPALLFGNLFPDVKTSWFTVFDNYLIFADSFTALGKIILSNILGETLIADSEYIKFQSGLTSMNNYYFFCNSSITFPEANLFFSSDISNDISSNNDFGKFKYIAWQVSSSGNMIYNNACMFYNPNISLKPQTVWQSHLLSALRKKPLIVENRFDRQNNEIILTDSKNNVYMLNSVGRIVWQINVESPVLSDIHVIDFNKNGDYQLVFNTKEKLFIIDKKGNNIENFPVHFRVNATNGVSVFDYENTRNYRFFVASEDRLIYAFDSDGKVLEGWQPYKTDHFVYQPIQHFSVEGKDYIVASDQMKDYIFDRKGNIRVQTDIVYQHSKNNTLYLEKRTKSHEPRLVTTDSKGNIHRTYFNGSHETIEFNELDDSHYFSAANADEDEENEYLFVQGNHIIVQKNNGRSLFNQKIDYEITGNPCVFNFSPDNKKIGVNCSASNKIFLFDSNGTVYKGFPLDGCSEFNIDFISDDHSSFHLLVGSPDGYLYNYLVE